MVYGLYVYKFKILPDKYFLIYARGSQFAFKILPGIHLKRS